MRTENKDKELNHRHFIGLRLTDVELDLLDQGAACFLHVAINVLNLSVLSNNSINTLMRNMYL